MCKSNDEGENKIKAARSVCLSSKDYTFTSFLGGKVGGGACEVSEKRLWWEGTGAPCCRRGDGARNGELGSDAPRIKWAWSCCRCVAAPTPGCIPSAGEIAPARG